MATWLPRTVISIYVSITWELLFDWQLLVQKWSSVLLATYGAALLLGSRG